MSAAATHAASSRSWGAAFSGRAPRAVSRARPLARAACLMSAGGNAEREKSAGESGGASGSGSDGASTSTSERRISRSEALRRTDAVIARRPTLAETLRCLDEVSRAAGIPPARCVWFSKLWAHASRRWSLPELLSACKAVEGAELAELVRLAGVNGAPTTALGLFREARALGWCDADGGAAVAAMAWIHDGAGQAKAADALWAELHERARRGDVDVAALRRAAGVKPWGVKKHPGNTRRPDASRVSTPTPRTRADASDAPAPDAPSPIDVSRARFETFAVEVASKARRRPRAAVAAYVRMRDGDPAANWSGRGEAGAPSRYPRRVFTAACRAASRAGDVAFASRVAVDMATDGVVPDTYAVACLVPILGRTGRAVDADAAEAIFLRAREEGSGTPLGGVAWSCAIGAACRAGRLDRAAELLAEMGEEPFMREWPSCPVPGGRMKGEGEGGNGEGEGEGEGGASSSSSSNSSSNSSSSRSSTARDARRAAAERRAAAPAYAQVMHALCDAGRHADALGIHETMRAAGVSGLSNPPHYRALFKATAGAGGKGGGPLPPRKAAARTVADAVLAAVAASRGEAPFLPYDDSDEEDGSDDAEDGSDDSSDESGRVRVRRSDRESVASPSRAMATATALGDATLSATAIRATLQVAAAGGFPDVASEARARMRWARVPSAPEDLELTLEAYARAGDARGAVAHWNANRRALSAEAEAAEGEASMVWEVGSDGVLVSGCEPTPRAWTAVIKAHCDAGEVTQAAALLQEAIDAESTSRAREPSSRGARRRRASEKPSERNRRGGVERVAFNLVAAAFSRAGMPRRAEDLLWLMDAADVKPDEATYNTIIGAYAAVARPPGRARDTAAAGASLSLSLGLADPLEYDAALDTSIALAKTPDRNVRSRGIHAPDEEFARDDEEDPVDAAFRLLREMRSPRVRIVPGLRAWTAVVAACARAEDVPRATEAFDRMLAAGVTPDNRAWTALMNAHAAVGDAEATAATYWRARAAGIAPDEATLDAALVAARRGDGDVGAAVAVYRDMRSLDVRPNNAGFRQLTGMWVDRAFASAEGVGGGTKSSSSSSSSSSSASSTAPNFMLAEFVEGDDGDGARDSSTSGPLVDVHGLSTVETRAAVLSVLQALRERRRARLPVSGDLVVVTGVGRRSAGEPALRDAVERLARDLNLEVRAAPGNAGRLVAKEAALLAWLDRGARSGGGGEGDGGGGGGGSRESGGSKTAANASPDASPDDAPPTRRRRRRRSSGQRRARDVPGLDVALREWLTENDAKAA